MSHRDTSPAMSQRGSDMSHTAYDSRQASVVQHGPKDPEKNPASAKILEPSSSFDVYGDEEKEGASKSSSLLSDRA